LAGLGLALVTCGCGRRWLGPRQGLLAGAIVGTSYGYFTIARSSLPDLPLAFFITVAAWGLFEATAPADAARPVTPRARTAWILLAAFSMGLGMLTKGPVGLALPALVILVHRAVTRQTLLPSRQGWIGLTWGQLFAGGVLLLVVAVPWYLAMTMTHGIEYLERFFVGENLERFATDRYNERRPFWFYVPIVVGGLIPWSPLLALWVRPAVRVLRGQRRLTELEWRLILWAAVPLIFYTLSVGQQPRYILPVLPALAILASRTMLHRIDQARTLGRRHLPLVWAVTGSAVILLVLALLLHRARPLLFALSPFSGRIGTIVIVLAGLTLIALAWFGRHSWLPAAVTTAATATLLALHYSVYSAAGLEPVQQMARLVLQVRQHEEPSGTYRAFVRNLVFYTGVKQNDLVDEREAVEFLSRPERVLCVMPLDLLEELEDTHQLRLRRLGSVLYFNPAGVRVRTLLSPEPERDLETVVLVSNR
ncbi:MAG TPA: phospholipid carrier-dependent glycosyltransferase, partial [Vicinamibacterales bacterium]